MSLKAKGRLLRWLSTACVGCTLATLTVAACNVPEFEFPDEPPGEGGSGGVVPADHCINGLIDDDLGETDFDCGGGCPPCGVGQRCLDVADCLEGLCYEETCIAAGCVNRVQDGTETDVDCGGGGCGACITGKTCAQESDCESGVCVDAECLAPACDDQVVNGKETGLDCGGGCPPCPADEPCLSGRDCTSMECNDGVCGSECSDGFANCDQDNGNACEVNVRTDVENCGACANACDLPHATAECSAGECRIATDGCEPGYVDCNGKPEDGCEVNVKTSELNCGTCNNACPEINGTPRCEAGVCQISCNDGFEDCDGKHENGCEANLNSSVRNCSECGKICTASAGNSPNCKQGVCGQTTCAAGKGDCIDDAPDNCETTLTNDAMNCGGCGIECVAANADVACVNSKCVIASCKPGFADCTLGFENGCETDTTTSIAHCGECGNACAVANGTPRCDDGSCEIGSCSGTFRDCDGDPKNGCEVNIATSTPNCGGCGAAGSNCATKYPNANSTCSGGSCATPVCDAGFGDCGGGITDGCETNLTNTPAHCGACNQACSTNASAHVSSNACSSSQCNPVCAGTYATCDNDKFNGCEVNKDDDESHCGGCGITCSTSASAHVTSNSCVGGACDPECAGTFGDCDTSRTNGCEVDMATSATHCGACNNGCSTAASAHVTSNSCSGGDCNPVCAALYADCDDAPENGCETSVAADEANCGACNITCSTAASAHVTSNNCGGGVCAPVCAAFYADCDSSRPNGCETALGTTANCTECGESCSGATPFCETTGCTPYRNIVVANAGATHDMTGWTGNGDPSALTVNHTLGTAKGGNRMLLVGVVASDSLLDPESIVVTYNGTQMLPAVEQTDSGKQSYSGIYYLLDAALPTNAGTVSQVTAQFWPVNRWGHGGLDVVELRNTMQVAPIATGTATGGNCGGTSARSVNVTFNQPGSLVYAVLSGRAATAATLTTAAGLTATWNEYQPTPDRHIGAAAYVFDDDSRSITWNLTGCFNSAATSVAIKRLSAN